MATSPDDLRNKTFSIVKKGYERGEVHRFLGNVADELQQFNRSVASQEEIVIADVVEVNEVEEVIEDVIEETPIDTSSTDDVITTEMPDPEEEPVASASEAVDREDPAATTLSSDDFDRVGNEISLMLRQAQESSLKIRNDAEVEARTLVDQVRLDIESDRLAHEQAAAELISRTEERAGSVRSEAEDYAAQVRSSADDYSEDRRAEVEREHADSLAAADADRKLAASELVDAESEAEAKIAEAQKRADEIIANAETAAQEKADLMLAEARTTLGNLIGAEKSSRSNLEEARAAIEAALAQLKLTEAAS